jgi:glycosyltransferase involved in cell wall biosynthesis
VPFGDTANYTHIRIRPELRAAQVERASLMTPAHTLYFAEKYDLGETHLPIQFTKVGLLEAMRIFTKPECRVLEVPEPLWLRFLPKTMLLAISWKAAGLARRQSRVVVTYAIENNDLGSLLSPRRRLPRILENMAAACLGGALRLTINRIAFGSSGAQRLYHSLPGVSSINSRLVEELPAAKDRPDLLPTASDQVVFLGELDGRKGIRKVLSVWPVIEKAKPDAHITIAGNGRLAAEVQQWCLERPESRTFKGFVQHEQVSALLAGANVLVAPSLREGRWREQIGLPIVEALSQGLTIVTTDETGLAEWLGSQGHHVISEPAVDIQLSEALMSAISSPLDPAEVMRSLPTIAGRVASDAWLHSAYRHE